MSRSLQKRQTLSMHPRPPAEQLASEMMLMPTAASPGDTVVVQVAMAALCDACAPRIELALSAHTATNLVRVTSPFSRGNTILPLLPVGLRTRMLEAGKKQNEVGEECGADQQRGGLRGHERLVANQSLGSPLCVMRVRWGRRLFAASRVMCADNGFLVAHWLH